MRGQSTKERARTACPICGRNVREPRKVYVNGRLYECCVSIDHDPYVPARSEHGRFVARARAAGIDGRA